MLFISYSHDDEAFVNRLIARLLEARVSIWYDRIGIKVGESLLEKIQGAIAEADFLAVVLSKASVQSAWCQEELNAGLIRQLTERRVFLLPLLIAECDIPLFLRDKKYADFQTDFERGFQELREAIAASADLTLGRKDGEEFQTDYALDWNIRDGQFVMEIDGVHFSKKQPYSVMTRIRIVGNDVATRRYRQFQQAGLKEVGMTCVVAACQELFDVPDAHLSLDDNKPMTIETRIADSKTDIVYNVTVWARRIGQATGTSILFHFGAIFGGILAEIVEHKTPMTDEQKRRLAEILSTPPP